MFLTCGLWRVATVLTACGIETYHKLLLLLRNELLVATVLTACGIETSLFESMDLILENSCNSTYRLRY